MNQLLAYWGLELGAGKVTPLRGGVWLIEYPHEKYILKRRSMRSSVWAEYDLINWLQRHKQPVSPLLYTTKDVPWAEYDGSIYVLYSYLQGVPGDETEQLATNFAQESGGALSRLHLDLASYPVSHEFAGFDLFHEVAGFAWPTVCGYLGQSFRNRLRDLEDGISRNLVNPYENLPRQLIHRDFHPGNLIFQDQQLVGILDFDRVRVGIRLYDLCYLSTAVLSQSFSDFSNRERWPQFIQTLINSYTQVQALSKAEVFSFLYIVYLIQFLFIAHHLDAGNTDLADVNIAMLLWINDQHTFLESLIEKAVVN